MFSRQIDAIVSYPNNYLNISKRALRGKLIKKSVGKGRLKSLSLPHSRQPIGFKYYLHWTKFDDWNRTFSQSYGPVVLLLVKKNNKLISPLSFQCKQRECWNRDWPLDETKGTMNGHLIKGFFVDLTKVATYLSQWTTYLFPKLS